MGLARTNNPLSQVIIRNIGDVGGPRADSVNAELDNIINWAKLSPRNINTDTSTVGNVGAGLDVLHTYTLDTPFRLATNGDYLRVRYAGTFATNDNDKRIQIDFGNNTVVNSGLFDQDSGSWVYDILYTRVSSTTVRVSLMQIWGAFTRDGGGTMGGNTVIGATTSLLTGLTDLSANSQVLKVSAEGTADNDIQQFLSIIELRQQ